MYCTCLLIYCQQLFIVVDQFFLVLMVGIEPTTSSLPRKCDYHCATSANLERGRGIEPLALAWKAKVLPLYEPRINNFMYTYDAITKTGIQIHLSMSENNTCYIFINDIYNNQLRMKFFTDMQSAIEFIHSF